MKESEKNQYKLYQYSAHFYYSLRDIPRDGRSHVLKFRSSCTDGKDLLDTAVRLAKSHRWEWTSILIVDSDGQSVGLRIARKQNR